MKAGQLHLYTLAEWKQVNDGKITIEMELPRQAISLLKFDYQQ